MRTDNTANLITAAHRRHELTRSKTIQALHELDASGAPVTYQVVARRAQVSRSWLYTQPDIRAEIERLRDHGRRPPASPIPTRQRTTEPSLQRRLETATARIRELNADNHRLRRQLEQALGQQRAHDHHERPQPTPAPAPSGNHSVTIGPCSSPRSAPHEPPVTDNGHNENTQVRVRSWSTSSR